MEVKFRPATSYIEELDLDSEISALKSSLMNSGMALPDNHINSYVTLLIKVLEGLIPKVQEDCYVEMNKIVAIKPEQSEAEQPIGKTVFNPELIKQMRDFLDREFPGFLRHLANMPEEEIPIAIFVIRDFSKTVMQKRLEALDKSLMEMERELVNKKNEIFKKQEEINKYKSLC